jgi:hypothetical protein
MKEHNTKPDDRNYDVKVTIITITGGLKEKRKNICKANENRAKHIHA